jgi:hypothetical protein
VSDFITTPDQYAFMDKPKLLGEVPYTQGFISTQHTSSSSSSSKQLQNSRDIIDCATEMQLMYETI